MANVGAIIKVLPEGTEVDLKDLENKIKKAVNPKRIERQPIAFGLQALMVTVVIQEAEGATDSLEEKIRAIEGVSEVSVESVSRLVE